MAKVLLRTTADVEIALDDNTRSRSSTRICEES